VHRSVHFYLSSNRYFRYIKRHHLYPRAAAAAGPLRCPWRLTSANSAVSLSPMGFPQNLKHQSGPKESRKPE
jgi:hypothetical protein